MLWEGLLHRPWLWLMGVCLPAVGGARSRHLVPALAGVDPLPWPETAAAQRPREGPQALPGASSWLSAQWASCSRYP